MGERPISVAALVVASAVSSRTPLTWPSSPTRCGAGVSVVSEIPSTNVKAVARSIPSPEEEAGGSAGAAAPSPVAGTAAAMADETDEQQSIEAEAAR